MSNPSDPNEPDWGRSPQPGGWQQPFPGGGDEGGWGGQPSGWDQPGGAGYGAPPGYQAYSPYGTSSGTLAGWWQRVGATIVDGILFGIIYVIFRSTGGVLLGYAVAILGQALYVTLMLGIRGQTLGNMAAGTRVVDAASGQPIGYPRALLRWFVQNVLSVLIIIGTIIDDLFPLWDGRNQTLHDKASTSVVIRVR